MTSPLVSQWGACVPVRTLPLEESLSSYENEEFSLAPFTYQESWEIVNVTWNVEGDTEIGYKAELYRGYVNARNLIWATGQENINPFRLNAGEPVVLKAEGAGSSTVTRVNLIGNRYIAYAGYGR